MAPLFAEVEGAVALHPKFDATKDLRSRKPLVSGPFHPPLSTHHGRVGDDPRYAFERRGPKHPGVGSHHRQRTFDALDQVPARSGSRLIRSFRFDDVVGRGRHQGDEHPDADHHVDHREDLARSGLG